MDQNTPPERPQRQPRKVRNVLLDQNTFLERPQRQPRKVRNELLDHSTVPERPQRQLRKVRNVLLDPNTAPERPQRLVRDKIAHIRHKNLKRSAAGDDNKTYRKYNTRNLDPGLLCASVVYFCQLLSIYNINKFQILYEF